MAANNKILHLLTPDCQLTRKTFFEIEDEIWAEVGMGVYSGEPKHTDPYAHTDRKRTFYNSWEMEEKERSVSKVNEY